MTDEAKRTGRCVTLSLVNVIVGWIITFGSAMWYIGQKTTSYELQIAGLQKEVNSLDERLDTSESFRSSILTDLAEIKTDLIWIRKTLENGK